MSSNRKAITCNGRAAFYACMWDDIRQCAMDCGWAVALHGSLVSDMDIMAMPWVEEAVAFEELIDRISKLFSDNNIATNYTITYNEKPHNRTVATIPIYSDFYLDISTITTKKCEKNEKRKKKSTMDMPINSFDIYHAFPEEWFEQLGDFSTDEDEFAPIDYKYITTSLYEGNSFFGGEIVDLSVDEVERVYYIHSSIRQPIGDYGWETIHAWYVSDKAHYDEITKLVEESKAEVKKN